MKLKDSELYDVKGGASKGLALIIIASLGGIISLIAGIIDGYINPIKCR